MIKRRKDEIRRLVKSVCKPVAMPPGFKKRLLERLAKAQEGGDEAKNKDI